MQVKKLQNQNRILIFSQLFTEFSSLVTFFKIFKFISRDATEKTEAWSEQKKASNLRNHLVKINGIKLQNDWNWKIREFEAAQKVRKWIQNNNDICKASGRQS